MYDPVTVIIPSYNEESAIGNVIEQIKTVLLKAEIPHEIIVVDDGSIDQTSAAAGHAGTRVIRHEENIGYGAALKTGIRMAQNEIVVITDADGTYPSERIPEMLDSLRNADMVVGSRTGDNVEIPLIRRPAKWILRRLAKYITGANIRDLNSGLRAFRRQFAEYYLNILPDQFSFTTTLTVAALCDHYKVTYIPIDYKKRVGKSKIVPWHFVTFVTLVLRLSMLFSPLKVLVPISLVCFLLGALKFSLDIVFAILRAEKVTLFILAEPIVSTTTLILLLSGLQILLIGMVSEGLVRKMERRTLSEYQSHSTKALTVNEREH